MLSPTGSGTVDSLEAKFELLATETFSDLEKFSSGFLNTADKSKITLSRIVDKGERLYTNYSHETIKGIELRDGDEIWVANGMSNFISKISEKNWIRVPKDEHFSVALRIYLPGEEYFSKLKRVDLPKIEKLRCKDE